MLAAACSGDAQFSTNFAPGFVPAHHKVSVLGVYRDGHMSSESWDAISTRIAPALGRASCEVGYDAKLAATHPALASAIDDYAQANGPTDDLVTQLAPASRGDLVLVLTLAGHPPRQQSDLVGAAQAAGVQNPATGGSRGAMGGGMQAGGRSAAPRGDRTPRDTNVVEMSASLFSVAEARSVGVLSLEYSGATVEDAVARFATRLAQALPGAECMGWELYGKVDPERIRKSIEQ